MKCPHMGWNDITFANGSSKLLDGVRAIADDVVLPSAKDSIGAYDPSFPTNYVVNEGNLLEHHQLPLLL